MIKKIWIAALLCFSSAFAQVVDAPVLNSVKTIVDITTVCTTATAPALQYFVQQSTGATFKCVGSVLTRWDIPTCPASPPSGTCSTQSLCKDGAGGDIWGCDSLVWKRFAMNTDKNYGITNPTGTDDAQSSYTYNLDHTDDRSASDVQTGFSQLVDFNSTSTSAKVGNVIGGRFRTRVSGSAATRTAGIFRSLIATFDSDATVPLTGSMTAYAIVSEMNFNIGQTQTFVRTAQLYISPMAALGSGSSIANHYGILIPDQGYANTGMTAGDAIRIDSQTMTAGVNEGNLRMAGGAYNTGHLLLGSTHLWEESSGVFAIKGSTPASASDGFRLAVSKRSTTSGIAAWAAATVSCDTACTNVGGMTCDTATCISGTGGGCTAIGTSVACNVTDQRRLCGCH